MVGAYQSVSVWDIGSGKKERDLPKHRGFVTSLAVSPDGKLLATGCEDEAARLIRIEDGSLLKTLEHSREPVLGVLLLTSAGVVFFTIIVDLAYTIVDPRIRLS